MRAVGVLMATGTVEEGWWPRGVTQRSERGPRTVGTTAQRPKSTRSGTGPRGKSPRTTTRVPPAAGPCAGTTWRTQNSAALPGPSCVLVLSLLLLLVLQVLLLLLVVEGGGGGGGRGGGGGDGTRARTWELWETTTMGLAVAVWTTV